MNNPDFSEEMVSYIGELVEKADVVNAKTEHHSNLHLDFGDLNVPLRIDDTQLLYIGGRLLPNIVNYLINILPQFIYPYVVSYLQSLSEMREDPITINELYQYLKDFDNGNIHECTQAES